MKAPTRGWLNMPRPQDKNHPLNARMLRIRMDTPTMAEIERRARKEERSRGFIARELIKAALSAEPEVLDD